MTMEATSKLLAHLTGYEGTQTDAEHMLRGGRKVHYHHAGDAAAATAYVLPIMECVKASRIKNANLIPEGALTADDTNYGTIGLGYNDGAGGAATTLVSVTTKITGGTGNWVAGTVEALAPDDADIIPAGSFLCLVVTKTGTGVDCPAYVIDGELELV